jgi:uncharacterized protein YdbL (DUF1318 family)
MNVDLIMTRQQGYLFICLCLGLVACVTVNVYFPAAAAEKAADTIIEDIYGEGSGAEQDPEKPADDRGFKRFEDNREDLGKLIEMLLPAAQAQPDITIATPEIAKLKAAMKRRHAVLLPFYQSGAVGMTRDGLVAIRDLSVVPPPDRKTVKQRVAEENRDRNALYPEIARANGHPEWERAIRTIFAQRWIANAPAGWWYQGLGGWQQK